MDIRTVSRAAAVTSIVVGAVAVALPLAVTGDEEAPTAQQLGDYAAHSDRALAANVLTLAVILMVPAMVFTARLARRRAPATAFIGGGLAALGWLAGLMSLGMSQIALYQGSRLPDRAAAATVVDAITGDAVFGTLVGIFVLGHIVGMIVLGVALWRSRAVPVWVAGLFVAYPVLHFVGHAGPAAIDYVARAALLIAAVGIAVRIVRTPNVEWDAPTGHIAPESLPIAPAPAHTR
jgi:hypothetical protein